MKIYTYNDVSESLRTHLPAVSMRIASFSVLITIDLAFRNLPTGPLPSRIAIVVIDRLIPSASLSSPTASVLPTAALLVCCRSGFSDRIDTVS